MGHLAVRLLGSYQVSLNGEPVTGFRSDKVRALLAYLCAEMARPHRRERVAGLLWPELPERSARSNLRTLLGERDTASPVLIATRQTLQIDPERDVWVDALMLADQAGGDLADLEQAVDLYRGEFMEGFTLADSPEFEEWVLFQRERFQRLIMEALTRLAEGLEAQGELERAQEYARRQVDMDPWREKAHRQVMRLLALSGQRAAALAQYEICRRVLAEGLGVEPSAETVSLARRIREGEPGASTVHAVRPPVLAAEPPPFLELDLPEAEPALFVGRERELARLQELLEMALTGEGRTIFVTGGPGRGKTALLSEFARQAMEAQPDLLVANGSCSALAGIGDAYLPFREIMAMLTGDLEARWYAGSITREHAQRLWGALPRTARALLEHSPNVIGTLVRGPALLSRATAATGSQDGAWLRRLGDLVQRQESRSEGMEQAFLFEQLTNSLRRLAEHHPLLLILDDLHWADTTSAGLLFHLGIRLRGSRILLASAYRPEEVAHALDGARVLGAANPGGTGRHPLQTALAELKRRYGDVWVDLAAVSEEEALAFVSALVDSEPNRLGGEFRDAMFRRTGGHPLFVVELLRAMQVRGDLVKDSVGYWTEGPELRWDLLPGRVEGVIEARIGRLSPELRDLLATASVEGEEFTAQVVAQVQHLDERAVLGHLSGDLDRRHRLVRASGETPAGRHRLSTYRFSHVLFRDYLYGTLGPGEKSLLHRRVGSALEALHEGQLEEIAARLAYHFAADPEKERHYARMAGEWAAAQYANEEALHHLGRALELTPDADREGRYALLLAREKIYDLQGDREEQQDDLVALEEVATALADPREQVEVTLRRSQYAWAKGDYSQAAALAEAAIDQLESDPDPELEARARRRLALAFLHQGQSEAGVLQLRQALDLARKAGSRWLEAEVLRHLGNEHSGAGRLTEARDCFEASRSIFQEVGDRFDEMKILFSLSLLSDSAFEYTQALEDGQAALRLSREFGWPLMEGYVLNSVSNILEACGDYGAAHDGFAHCLEIARDIGDRSMEAVGLTNLASVDLATGHYERALEYVGQALPIAREVGQRHVEAYAHAYAGYAHYLLGQHAEAKNDYQKTLDLFREMGLANEAVEVKSGLGLVYLAQGDLAGALTHIEEILSHLETSGLEGTAQPLRVYLACYRVLQACGDPRDGEVLEEAHALLQETASKIDDERLRPSSEFDEVSSRLARREFDTMAERDALFADALRLSLENSQRIWLYDRTSFSPRRSEVEVTADLAGGVPGAWLWPYTLRREGEVGGEMTIGMPDILSAPWNPIAGGIGLFDTAVMRATGDWAVMPDPYTGLMLPQRLESADVYVQEGMLVDETLDWVNLEFAGEIQVPDDAWVDWDAAEQRFVTAGEAYTQTQTARLKVVCKYPGELFETSWHDGSSFDLGDVVLSMIMRFDPSKPESRIYDEATVPALEAFASSFKGWRIAQEDPLVIEYYGDHHPMDAELAVSDMTCAYPQYQQSQGAWHMMGLGILAEEAGELAFSPDKAVGLKSEMTSYISGPSLEILEEQLQQAADATYIPYEPTLGQYVTTEEAQARWANYSDWYRSKGHFWIGNGPYYLDQVYPVEGNAVLERFAGYPDPADKWSSYVAPKIAEVKVDGPAQVVAGSAATYQVNITFGGEPYELADIAEVKYLIFGATGELVLSGAAKPVDDGLYEVVLSEDQTAGLEAGSNSLEVIVVPLVVSVPTFESIEFIVVP